MSLEFPSSVLAATSSVFKVCPGINVYLKSLVRTLCMEKNSCFAFFKKGVNVEVAQAV